MSDTQHYPQQDGTEMIPPEHVEKLCSARVSLDEQADLKLWNYSDGTQRVWAEISGHCPDIVLGECKNRSHAEDRARTAYFDR